jgi:hypothetical protein
VPPGHLSRQELIELVGRIMRGDGATEDEDDRLVELFEDSVVHPAATDLIFYPYKYFGEKYRGKEPTPEQVVDAALAYKPIELGPGS